MKNFTSLNRLLLIILLSISNLSIHSQEHPSFGYDVSWNTPKAGNPLLPGYFADPTIKKFGDTYYIYATTDGTGNGYGPPQVWVSKDFVHWQNVLMNWPTTDVVWAPDVVKTSDNKYRYYYCTPCVVRVGESDSPTGPWSNRLGSPDAVLVPDRFVHNAITLDPMLFQDDDGSEYLYFGTWGIYKGFGCGVAKLSADGKSFLEKKLIENTEITDFFEAPYVFKKDGKYYFTYSSGSCHDDTYRVQYAISENGPMGPYTYKGCILKTNSDGTVHGPGHHSILIDDNNYYIVYHRHNIPQSIHGFNRQICIDALHFDSLGNIQPIVPTHSGALPSSLQSNAIKCASNIAFGANVTASSFYSDDFKPSYIVDDNNATLWKAKNCNGSAWIQLDLGTTQPFNQIWTQFEYATFFYQYKIEISKDGENWEIYSDKSKNTLQGSPIIDCGVATARYIRLTILDTQKNGHFPAIWNIQVYNSNEEDDPRRLLPDITIDESALLSGYPWIHTKDVELSDREYTDKLNHKIISINASDYEIGSLIDEIVNKGTAGVFKSDKPIAIVPKNGKSGFLFDGHTSIVSDFSLPKTMCYNAPYTINALVLNPEIGSMECIAQFTPSNSDLGTIELRNGTSRNEGIIAHNASFENSGASDAIRPNEWQHWSIIYDGYTESIYCNGKKVSSKNNFLMLNPEGGIMLGNSYRGGLPFTGYLHSLELYDCALSPSEIESFYLTPTDFTEEDSLHFMSLSKLKNKKFKFDVQPISPTQSIVRIVDSDGNSLENGLYNYSLGLSKTRLLPINSDQEIVTTNGSPLTIYGKVHDVFGGASKIFKAKIKTNAFLFKEMASSLSIPFDSNGELKLESSDSYLEYDTRRCGPLSTVEISGNFLLECHVIDMTGLSRHSTPAYNEGGLIIIDPQDPEHQNLIHLGVFPNYNCGNMLTVVSRIGRPQYKNDKGWNYDPYLQLERRGNLIYARTSKDGTHWESMPNSPIQTSIPETKIIKVGLYQTTYTENKAYMTFDKIKIWKKK